MNVDATLLLVFDLSVALWLLVFLVVLLFGALIVISALALAVQQMRFRKSAAAVEGTVLKSTHDVKQVGGATLLSTIYSHSNYYANITARYEPRPGEPLEVTDKIQIPLGGQDYFDGDRVTVFYDPKNPKKARLARPSLGPIVLPSLVIGAVGGVVMLFSLVVFPWRLFDPSPPRGAFPDSVAGFTRVAGPEYDRYSGQSKFDASYGKARKTIGYKVVECSSAAEAKNNIANKHNLAGEEKILLNTGDRSVWAYTITATKKRGYMTDLAIGTHLIEISGDTLDDVIAFENGLPYAAFGVSAPPQRSASDVGGGDTAALAAGSSSSPERARQGQAVYQGLLTREKANLPQVYGMFGNGSLSLVIDQDEWAKLSRDQQVDLTFYVESLIPKARAQPESFIDVPSSAATFSGFVESAKKLCDDCWEVATGAPRQDGSISYSRTAVQGDSKWAKADTCCRGSKGSEFRGQSH